MPPNMPPSSYLASRLAQANGQLMPQGEPVAAFSRREEAFAAFDVLAAANYPITALYLVNEGLKQVEYPTQQGYGRPLLIALIQGILAGLFYSALVSTAGTNFLSAASSAVPIAVAVFVVWKIFELRRGGSGRYPMRGEAVPERTIVYALSDYSSEARRILSANPLFQKAVASASSGTPSAGTGLPHATSPYVSYTPTSAGESSQAPSTPSTVTDQQGGYTENRESAAENPNPEQADADGQQSSAAQEIPWQSPAGGDSQASQAAVSQTAAPQTQPDDSSEQSSPAADTHDRKSQAPAAQRFGLRIDDPEEYAKTIRQAPTRETPKPKGVKED